MDGFDAVIIGAGPAGSTMAGLLARDGWSVALIERAEFPRRKVCGEFLSATNAPVLDALGIGGTIRAASGPDIRRVGFFAHEAELAARMPAASNPEGLWGRALGREHLDTMLLNRAAALGVTILQPWSVVSVDSEGPFRSCRMESGARGTRTILARLVIAAHGSWEAGTLATQSQRRQQRPSDLLGFKAHFTGCDLSSDLMPLLVFPGGYGGMVTTDSGRVSLSCCVQRGQLSRIRAEHAGMGAGEAVLAHIRATTVGVRRALWSARTDGRVLGAGPIRPGIRPRRRDGVFLIGNAAGEAHPIVAEGISMAMQSAQLLHAALQAQRDAVLSGAPEPALNRVAHDYSRRWWWAFAPRIYVAGVFARLALRAPLSAAMRGVIGAWPQTLTVGAYLSGKTKPV